ncbi:hypothetical protein Q9966_016626 [Columba livia]|nr:hypothetical protein Q9966_016626 [Columba livia]
MLRSTKGASKARRDQINAEIRALRDLLPLPEPERPRLSYLHVMALACVYTRKGLCLRAGPARGSPMELLGGPELADLVASLPGFLLAVTREGKLVGVTDNVAQHLGHSMVDLVAQGDSIYDLLDPADHPLVRQQLNLPGDTQAERLFRCRFTTSRASRRPSAGRKLVLLRGRFQGPPGPPGTPPGLFVAFCAPLDPPPLAAPRLPPPAAGLPDAPRAGPGAPRRLRQCPDPPGLRAPGAPGALVVPAAAPRGPGTRGTAAPAPRGRRDRRTSGAGDAAAAQGRAGLDLGLHPTAPRRARPAGAQLRHQPEANAPRRSELSL